MVKIPLAEGDTNGVRNGASGRVWKLLEDDKVIATVTAPTYTTGQIDGLLFHYSLMLRGEVLTSKVTDAKLRTIVEADIHAQPEAQQIEG